SHPSVWAGRLVPLPAILPSPWPQNPVPNTPPTAEHPPTASPLPDMSYLGPPEALREADGHISILPSDGFHPAARESSPLSQLWLAHACIHENTFHDYAQLLMALCLESVVSTGIDQVISALRTGFAKTPSVSICMELRFTSQVCRYMPAPSYHQPSMALAST